MRIEICGAIGSGKTTIASLLSSSSFEVLYENFLNNPFWKAFYQNPKLHQFETEITFLLQHYHQIKNNQSPNIVCDFSLYQDLAFAKLGLEGKRLSIFEDVFSECISQIGPPDFLIRLDCEPSILVNRIKARGRAEESLIDASFLHTLQFFLDVEMKYHANIPILAIDSATKNFASEQRAQEEVVTSIQRLISRG